MLIQSGNPIVEIDASVFENADTTNRPPPEFQLPARNDLTRLDSNELRVCNFHINSRMLRERMEATILFGPISPHLSMPL